MIEHCQQEQPTGQYRYPRGKILVFAKSPARGRVKTRLAADIGEVAALETYQQLLETTLDRAVASQLSLVELWLDTENINDWLQHRVNQYGLTVRTQPDGDLGERMAAAIARTLPEADACLLIGADCPLLDGEYLYHAFEVLQAGTELVLGPAEDGGYVLVGMNKKLPALFASIDWGSAAVMQQTRQIIKAQQWRHRELPVLWDVDRIADWRRWSSIKHSEPVRAGCSRDPQ